MPVMKVLALIPPRPGFGPRLYDEIVRLVEVLTVISRIGVVEELLAARTAYPPGNETPAGDQIDLGQFLSHAQGMLQDWQRIAKEQDLHLLRNTREDGRFHVHHATHTEGIAVVLVERHGIEPQLFGITSFI